ncbi:hypothetical protein BH11BAC7_BH11BAC7_05980 [soil metagenome]
MKKKLLLLIPLLIFIITFLPAQVNLVPNPSFENDNAFKPITGFHWQHYKHGASDSFSLPNNKLVLADKWFQPTDGTPDILNSDSSHLFGFKTKTALTGNGRMGMITGICKNGLLSWLQYKDTYSEYIECKLTQPLVEGKIYCVRYYVALDEKSNFASHRFGFTITNDTVRNKNSHINMWGYDPVAHINEADDHYITSDEGWVMICDTFISHGGEQFLTLGSFQSEFPKRIHKVKKSEHTSLRVTPFQKFAYYYIDDVSLTEVLPGQPLCAEPRDTIPKNNLVFLIDVSGSMQQKGLIDEAKNAILSLANAVPAGDQITIIAYSGSPVLLAENIPAGDHEQIRLALEKIKPGGGTNAVGGFNMAYAAVRKRMLPDGTNKIIVLTDGKISLPENEKEKILTASEVEKIHLSIILFGDEVPGDMKKFAKSVGGNASAAGDGKTNAVLQKEVPVTIIDTPYGERNAGRITAYVFLTKVAGPLLLVLLVTKTLRIHTI